MQVKKKEPFEKAKMKKKQPSLVNDFSSNLDFGATTNYTSHSASLGSPMMRNRKHVFLDLRVKTQEMVFSRREPGAVTNSEDHPAS